MPIFCSKSQTPASDPTRKTARFTTPYGSAVNNTARRADPLLRTRSPDIRIPFPLLYLADSLERSAMALRRTLLPSTKVHGRRLPGGHPHSPPLRQLPNDSEQTLTASHEHLPTPGFASMERSQGPTGSASTSTLCAKQISPNSRNTPIS